MSLAVLRRPLNNDRFYPYLGKPIGANAACIALFDGSGKGAVPPMEIGPKLDNPVPDSNPVANISLLYFPKGSREGLTSLKRSLAIRPLPPTLRYFSVTSSLKAIFRLISTRRNVSIIR